MLFNSYSFIFLFLPVTLCVFFVVGSRRHMYGAAWLTLASLFFYGWWNPVYVALLLISIGVNYCVGLLLAKDGRPAWASGKKTLLIAGISADLLLLGYYKYANFFLSSINSIAGAQWGFGEIILPLGISFFTFTQIAFLVDTYQGKVKEYNLIHYALFVTYFPHLIAGPVLHHKEMMPQFANPGTYRCNHDDIAVGLTFFAIGLFKKGILADGIAPFATEGFAAAGSGQQLTLFDAWGTALAYTLQLYFDFSGYSDMAIGLSRLFGIKLPLNFDSPYKATNIIDFWRRWHMTLSRFLRDYLYFPLGGNRQGPARRYLNLLITMVLGGLWHGAGWTFVIWGTLHGMYLVINHLWRTLRQRAGRTAQRATILGRGIAWLITFVAVVVGWVFFRAANFGDAAAILRGMAGFNGVSLPAGIAAYIGPAHRVLQDWGVVFPLGGGSRLVQQYVWILVLLPIVLLAPNTQQFLGHFQPALDFRGEVAQSKYLVWRPSGAWAGLIAVLTAAGLLSLSRVSEFLYYQF
jgi:D-alanyl-lipoteichoic acid acyltransferase DltB (MBOAT superfamily)